MSIKQGWEGRFFEDFEVGDIYRSNMGRTITENDNIWFTLLTNNPNQIHFNNEYAKNTEFKQPLVNSLLTIAIVTGLTVQDVSQNGVNLGWDEVRLPHPVFAGDTLYSETTVLAKRESKSRSNQGIVTVKTRGLQQDGKIVIEFGRNILVWKKENAPSHLTFPTIDAPN
tara:strand:+ start:19 stop:525 length:507 start_codon:yes stop_codon:yes gene_type:complete